MSSNDVWWPLLVALPLSAAFFGAGWWSARAFGPTSAQSQTPAPESGVALDVLAHELRGPLQAAVGHVDLARSPERTELEIARDVERAAQALERTDLLLTRLTDGSTSVHAARNRSVELGALLQDVLADLEPRTRRRSLMCSLQIDAPVAESGRMQIWVEADPIRLRQALDNVAGNAVKYADEASWVDVSVSVSDLVSPADEALGDAASTEARTGAATAIIRITNPGISLAADEVEHAFEVHRRGHAAAACADGSGVGLAVVREVVEELGGEAHLSVDEESATTTATLRLPVNAI